MDTSTPEIQAFQFEAAGIGDLSKSVNLFRGDVNHHQTLLKLPDRPGRSDLEVELSIIYQSNVQDVVTLRNLDAPRDPKGCRACPRNSERRTRRKLRAQSTLASGRLHNGSQDRY
jgi:hypothetical protein